MRTYYCIWTFCCYSIYFSS